MITFDGLVAGETFLRSRIEEFDDGTPDGFHWHFIRELLMEVFRASYITLEMPDRCPDKPVSNFSEVNQDKGRLLVFVPGSADVDYDSGVFLHLD